MADEKRIKQILESSRDPNRVMMVCSKHHYTPGSGHWPAKGCKRCWFLFYAHLIAVTPAEERAQKLEELKETVHKLAELEDQGKLDFIPFTHPEIKITKEDA
jgi:hypothetical protein